MNANDEHDPFKQGEQDGHAAGLAGRSEPPLADLQLDLVDPVYRQAYERGASMGFARGRDERILIRTRAEHQVLGSGEERER